MYASVIEELSRIGLVPVIALERVEDAVPLAQALHAGGIACAEITFRTAAAAEAIRRIANEVPEVCVGAGTVLTVQQAQLAADAGARYIIAPGFDPAIVDWCLDRRIAVFPGVATPTEISMALAKGLTTLKFFPAEEIGGIRLLKALAAPFQQVRFIPTGGINAANLATYLALPNVAACGGSWLATKALIEQGQFVEITRLSKEARVLVREARGESKEML
jgi:2-dehydro-3-deoxyphosphogluconate aldolase / (4S)-4-hydroxy-2-oxoglutarate aldolase